MYQAACGRLDDSSYTLFSSAFTISCTSYLLFVLKFFYSLSVSYLKFSISSPPVEEAVNPPGQASTSVTL